ncbi:hypothetical protein [Cecembia rubra]|uniref:Outer membrane protein with beta-barrel domain n=1 Tax=Cecembia rubra TaxID=1485585 RepID=A0A2P8EAG1_9BACT|nr:hypothetical protein [Cecembia rubra]PSL06451.1 hypothetical protein CLV48_102267 [Cecembia rubra]
MRKLLLIICFALLVQFSLFAQVPGSQSVYVELGGAGLAYSFNYDFRFDKNNINSWGMRMGAGGWARNDSWRTEGLLTMPLQVNKLFGKQKHFFELGGGTTFIYYRDRVNDWNNGEPRTWKDFDFILNSGETPAFMGTLNFGYRRIPVDGGFTFKANLNPIFNHNGFWPLWVGVGFGYAF